MNARRGYPRTCPSEPGHDSARQGYLWTYARPGGNMLFDWQTGRGAKCLERVIGPGFSGTVQCDGYKAYPAFIRERPAGTKITLAGCLGARAAQVP